MGFSPLRCQNRGFRRLFGCRRTPPRINATFPPAREVTEVTFCPPYPAESASSSHRMRTDGSAQTPPLVRCRGRVHSGLCRRVSYRAHGSGLDSLRRSLGTRCHAGGLCSLRPERQNPSPSGAKLLGVVVARTTSLDHEPNSLDHLGKCPPSPHP